MSYFIFDIDGTLADIEHRRHFVRTKPKNWPAFNAAMKDDTPITPVVEVAKALSRSGFKIYAFSGREGSDANFRMTLDFLNSLDVEFHHLWMRKYKDHRPDHIVKKEFLDRVVDREGCKPLGVFDDRKQVVDMWIENDVFVFDVAQGKGDF